MHPFRREIFLFSCSMVFVGNITIYSKNNSSNVTNRQVTTLGKNRIGSITENIPSWPEAYTDIHTENINRKQKNKGEDKVFTVVHPKIGVRPR